MRERHSRQRRARRRTLSVGAASPLWLSGEGFPVPAAVAAGRRRPTTGAVARSACAIAGRRVAWRTASVPVRLRPPCRMVATGADPTRWWAAPRASAERVARPHCPTLRAVCLAACLAAAGCGWGRSAGRLPTWSESASRPAARCSASTVRPAWSAAARGGPLLVAWASHTVGCRARAWPSARPELVPTPPRPASAATVPGSIPKYSSSDSTPRRHSRPAATACRRSPWRPSDRHLPNMLPGRRSIQSRVSWSRSPATAKPTSVGNPPRQTPGGLHGRG